MTKNSQFLNKMNFGFYTQTIGYLTKCPKDVL